MWVPAAQVAEEAVAGLEKGRSVVIPGLANKLSARAAALTPRSLLVPVLAKGHPGLR